MPPANLRRPLVPDFEVKIDGWKLPPLVEMHVGSVTVEEDVDLPTMCAIALSGSEDRGQVAPWCDDRDLFAVGKEVEIRLGYAGSLEKVFVGETTGLEPEFVRDSLPRLTVRGYDRRHRLQRGRRTQTYLEVKDSDIFQKIGMAAGLSTQVDSTSETFDHVFQANQSDWDFLRSRARRIGCEIAGFEKTLLVRKAASGHGDTLTLTLEDDLLEFCPRLSAVGQADEVAVHGWDPQSKQEIVGKATHTPSMGGATSAGDLAKAAFGAASEVITASPVASQNEATSIAEARLSAMALSLVSGEGSCFGRPDLRAGQVVKIEGVGARFSGEYYLSGVRHRYSRVDGYRTRFTFLRSGI